MEEQQLRCPWPPLSPSQVRDQPLALLRSAQPSPAVSWHFTELQVHPSPMPSSIPGRKFHREEAKKPPHLFICPVLHPPGCFSQGFQPAPGISSLWQRLLLFSWPWIHLPVLFPIPRAPHPPPRAAHTRGTSIPWGLRSGTSPELLQGSQSALPTPLSALGCSSRPENHPKSTLQCWLCLFWWFPISSTSQELKGDPKIVPWRFPPVPVYPSPCLAPASSQSNGESPSMPKYHP